MPRRNLEDRKFPRCDSDLPRQVLHVESKCSIKEFILENSLIFKTGRGFYEFTKPEVISHKKEVLNCPGQLHCTAKHTAPHQTALF